MAKGKSKTETEIAEILFDAAREGVSASQAKHGCGLSTIYSYQHRYPDFWARVEAQLKPVVKMDAYEMGSLARRELMRRLAPVPTTENPNPKVDIGTGQLIGIIREAYSIHERYARMDAMKDPREALLKALKDKDPEIIALVKEILWAISDEDLEQVLHDNES